MICLFIVAIINFVFQNWEVLNTAVLTGRQVSQAMKIFIVSQAGKAADVTFQASCHSEDDSVLKVKRIFFNNIKIKFENMLI